MSDSGKYSTIKIPAGVPPTGKDENWVKCKKCGHTLYPEQLKESLWVCPYCQYHLAMSADDRIALLTDAGSFQEFGSDLRSVDTLKFFDSKSYADRLSESERKTGLNDAVRCGAATLGGRRFMLGVMDFRFMGASMGSVVGEKITELFEKATAAGVPAVMVTASGGARMQEGILSLMQMPKTCSAIQRQAEKQLLYAVIMTNPTYGGVTASFGSLGDVIIAEPGAMIGFAGPRVIQETTNSKLPEGFQTAEFLLEKGLIDRVTHRKDLRRELQQLLVYVQAKKA